MIGSIKIEFNKVKQKSLTVAKGNCMPYLSKNRTKGLNICCRQITKMTTFQSNQNKRTYTIYHNVNFKSKYTIYLVECTKCKLQYWDTSTLRQVSNCDGVMLKIYLDHKFQWPQEVLNCESLVSLLLIPYGLVG